jgi:TPR repeat protein
MGETMSRIVAIIFALALPSVAQAQTPSDAVQECLRIDAKPPVYDSMFDSLYRRAAKNWAQACKPAEAAAASDPKLAGAVARALLADGQRAKSIPFLRIAGAGDDSDALYEIFEDHKSWERGDLSKTQLVDRAEADRALRKAAELGNNDAVLALAVRLERGEIVKGDTDEALVWMRKLLVHPPKELTLGDVRERVARLESLSRDPDTKIAGRASLELLARAGRGDAKADLARVIRGEDAARARRLLEEALRSYPGNAAPMLADMLIKGEGGPADPKRAVAILKSVLDVPDINGALGVLTLEGKVVPRDIQEAARLLFIGSTFNRGYELQLTKMLADFPEATLQRPEQYLYGAMEAAEVDEPGARAALVALKLSQNTQFRDVKGRLRAGREMDDVDAGGMWLTFRLWIQVPGCKPRIADFLERDIDAGHFIWSTIDRVGIVRIEKDNVEAVLTELTLVDDSLVPAIPKEFRQYLSGHVISGVIRNCYWP